MNKIIYIGLFFLISCAQLGENTYGFAFDPRAQEFADKKKRQEEQKKRQEKQEAEDKWLQEHPRFIENYCDAIIKDVNGKIFVELDWFCKEQAFDYDAKMKCYLWTKYHYKCLEEKHYYQQQLEQQRQKQAEEIEQTRTIAIEEKKATEETEKYFAELEEKKIKQKIECEEYEKSCVFVNQCKPIKNKKIINGKTIFWEDQSCSKQIKCSKPKPDFCDIQQESQQLDRSDVERVINAHRASVKRFCWEPISIQKNLTSGQVFVRVKIVDGKIFEIFSSRSHNHNNELTSCVLGRVKSWKFPKNVKPFETMFLFSF